MVYQPASRFDASNQVLIYAYHTWDHQAPGDAVFMHISLGTRLFTTVWRHRGRLLR